MCAARRNARAAVVAVVVGLRSTVNQASTDSSICECPPFKDVTKHSAFPNCYLEDRLRGKAILKGVAYMEWTTVVWIALAAFMVFNIARGGGCCGGHRTKPASGETKKMADR